MEVSKTNFNFTNLTLKQPTMKTKILFLAIALIGTISCSSVSEKKVETINEADTTNTSPVEVATISKVIFYHPNLEQLFLNTKTKKEKEAIWLKVKDEGEKNWLMINDIYEKKWLATKDSAEKAWLVIKDQAFNKFKEEDPNAYQQYVALEKSGKWKAVTMFEQTTTSIAYKKYEKTQLKAWKNSEDIQLKAWKNSEDIQLKAWKIYDDAISERYSKVAEAKTVNKEDVTVASEKVTSRKVLTSEEEQLMLVKISNITVPEVAHQIYYDNPVGSTVEKAAYARYKKLGGK